MRKQVILASLLALAAIFLGGGIAIFYGFKLAQPVVAHRKSGKATEYDFGAVFPGQRLSHTFVLIGPPGGPVCHFTKVETSCGCTSAQIRSRALRPGKSVSVIVHVETKYWPGPELVLVRAFGEAGGIRRQYIFRVLYHVRRVISIIGNPIYLNLGDSVVGQGPAHASFSVIRGSNPMEWDSLTCTSTSHAIVARLRSSGPGRWRLDLRLRSINLLGSPTFPIDFHFWNHGKVCTYFLPQLVTAEIRGPVTASPDAILIGAVQEGGTRRFRIRIMSPSGGVPPNTRVVAVRSSDEKRISARVVRVAGFPSVLLRYVASSPSGRDSGSVTIIVESAGKRFVIRDDYLAMILPHK